MSILDSTYDINVGFADIFEVSVNDWKYWAFDRVKCSDEQWESKLKLQTFDEIAVQLSSIMNQTFIRRADMVDLLQQAISKYMLRGFIYPIYDCNWHASKHCFRFDVWSQSQREFIFEMDFKLKTDD